MDEPETEELPVLEGRAVFTVTDLKQFAYCPRVVYYTYCLPLIRPETAKMQESRRAHEEEARREERRSLRLYGLPEGERRYDVLLCSTALGLRGKADVVIRTADELIPVDYKMTSRPAGPHFRLQLAAYGLMLSEMEGLPVRRGFVYSTITRQAEEVRFTRRAYAQVRSLTEAMRRMVDTEAMPEAPQGRARCVACEFRRFCNDL